MALDLRLVANGGLCAETDSVAASDTTGIITATASTITFTGLATNVAYHRSIDYGANYFTTNFGWSGTLAVTSQTGTGTKLSFIGVATTGPYSGESASNTNELALRFGNTAANTTHFQLTAVCRESGTNNNGTSTGSIANGTVYYDAMHTTAVGGQHGAFVVKAFSNSGKTAFVGATFKALSVASPGYRYFYPIQSYNAAIADTQTGTSGDITLTTLSNGIDQTTGTEVDIPNKLTIYSNITVATALDITAANPSYNSIDYGASHFTNYKVSGILNITAFGTAGIIGMFNILCVSNNAADGLSATDMQGIDIACISSSTYTAYIQENVGGTPSYSTAGPTLNTGVPYHFVLERSGSTLTLKIYQDIVLTNFAGLCQVGSTLTWTSRATTAYRYLMPVTSHRAGATSRTSTFTLGQLNATTSLSQVETTSGGFVVGGAVTSSKSSHFTTSGGFVAGGAVSENRSSSYIMSGGFVVGGNAPTVANGSHTASETMSGGFIVGGKSPVIVSRHETTRGGFVVGGVSPYSYNLHANVQEIIFELYDSTGAAITSATPTCIIRTTPGATIYDWADATFKSSGWTTIEASMSEVNSTYLPGKYKVEINVGNFANGRYQAYCTYTATQNQHGTVEFLVDDGQLVDEYTAGKVDLIEKFPRYKHVLNDADGTVHLYDQYGTLLWSGLAYMDAAGTQLYDGTRAVHHTTFLT